MREIIKAVKTLKITIKEPPSGAEEEIIVLCHNISPELLEMLNAFKTVSSDVLIASVGNELHKIKPSDIYYFEAVDKKTFIYCEKNVYESKQKLYEIDGLALKGFFRISKSVIVNLGKVKSVVPSLSGRAEAILDNKERVVISRYYVDEFKKTFGI